MAWISFTLFAALMQSVRTAGQKQLAGQLGALLTSWARFGFGLPVAGIYLILIYFYYQPPFPQLSALFWLYVFIASVAQLIATILLVKVLSMCNFASATTYAKTETLLAAIFAAIIFHSQISLMAWLAIAMGGLGIVFVSVSKSGLKQLANPRATSMGLSAGLCFALTAVYVRQASLTVDAPQAFSAALILFFSLLIQGLLCTVLVHRESPDNWAQLKSQMTPAWFIGITGALGSIGWFTALAMQNAAIVKTLGQVEFIFTVIITYRLFKERIHRYEWAGIFLVILSILLLLFAQS